MFEKKQVIRNILNSDENRLARRHRSSTPFFLTVLIGFLTIIAVLHQVELPDIGEVKNNVSLYDSDEAYPDDPLITTVSATAISTVPTKVAVSKDSTSPVPTKAAVSKGSTSPAPTKATASTGSTSPAPTKAAASTGSTNPDPGKDIPPFQVTQSRIEPVNETGRVIPIDEIMGPKPSEVTELLDGKNEEEDRQNFENQFILAQAKDYLEGKNGKAKDYEKAIPILLDISKRGSAGAQFELAKIYRFGLGVEENINTAVSYYKKAADNGSGDAQCSLGALYYKGTGVTKNYTTAVLYFKKAANQGDRTGQFNLACSYLDGTGIKKNREEALKWFKLSAEQDYKPAIDFLKKISE
jgi:hypothetical protein